MKNSGKSIHISTHAWISLLVLGLVLWMIINFSGLIVEVSGILFGAFLLGLAVNPVIDRLARIRIPRGITLGAIYLLLIAALVLMGGLLVPVINLDLSQLQANGPNLIQGIVVLFENTPWLQQVVPSTSTLSQNLLQRMDLVINPILDALTGLGDRAVDIILVFVFAYFFSIDTTIGDRLITTWLAEKNRSQFRNMIAHIAHYLSRWVRAQLGIALYFAVSFSVVLSILGVPFAVTIGIVGGILEIVPYLGGAIAFILAVLSALTVQPLLALWVFIAYLIIVEVESHFIAPILYGRMVGLHPAVVLIALVVGIKALGVFGALFAVPIAVMLIAIIREVKNVQNGKVLNSSPNGSNKQVEELNH